MEPSAVLVAAFEIEISREGQVRFLAKDGGIARAGLEPDIDDVGFFPEFCSAALGALAANRKPIGFWRIPRVRAGAGKELDHSAVHLGIAQGLAAAFTYKHRDGQTPDALARDAPVGAGGGHVGEAV